MEIRVWERWQIQIAVSRKRVKCENMKVKLVGNRKIKESQVAGEI